MLITVIIIVWLTIQILCREHMTVLIIQKCRPNFWIRGSNINRDWINWRINTNRWVTKCIWRNVRSSPGLITLATKTLIITTTKTLTNKTIPAITYPAYHHQSYHQTTIVTTTTTTLFPPPQTSATHRNQFRGWNKPAG